MNEKDTGSGAEVMSPSAPAALASKRAMRRGRGTVRRTPDQPCLNCGDSTPGDYCRACGQGKRKVAVSLGSMISDVLEDQLVLNRTLPRTLLYLLFRPGFLTVEYVNGRIVRYIAPFRLYLATSIVFFLLLSFFGLRALDGVNIGGSDAAAPDTAALAAGLAALDNIDTTGMPPDAREAFERGMRLTAESVDEAVSRAAAAGDVEVDVRVGGLQPWAAQMLRSGNDRVSRRLVNRVTLRYGHLPPGPAVREFVRQYLEYVPHTVFLLLPLFALILKVLYIRRGRFYAEHFVFALHIHALTFVVFTLMFLIGNGMVNAWLFFGIMLYAWLAMKRVYGQGWFRTTTKYFMLGFIYVTLLSFAILVPAAVALLLA